jgi:hypothetical protein
MPRKTETAADVEQWFQKQAAGLWPAALGSLSLRRSPCVRENCAACRSGEQHPSHVLYVRIKGRRFAIYIPEQLVPEIRLSLDNGRVLQELLHQTAIRYTKALKHQRATKIQKVNHDKTHRAASQLR